MIYILKYIVHVSTFRILFDQYVLRVFFKIRFDDFYLWHHFSA